VEHRIAAPGWLRRIAARVPRLPQEAAGVPLHYTPALVIYVGLLAAGATAAAVVAPAAVAVGSC